MQTEVELPAVDDSGECQSSSLHTHRFEWDYAIAVILMQVERKSHINLDSIMHQ